MVLSTLMREAWGRQAVHPSLLLGWAGWNHRDQAEALVNLISDRVEHDGWKREDPRFVPLLAGLLEVIPWVQAALLSHRLSTRARDRGQE
ncbi:MULTISPECIES: DUF7008 domain-containing protein [unclassified Streptomyces]|uniref:DUF7008 domain-containing protein n=1 Tax=unclassified Streptomyces TaxID=2593676 RepID=UPI0036491933